MSKQPEELFSLPGVIGFGYGKKEVKGRVTRKKAFIVFVQKKIPLNELKDEEIIPSEINGTLTDVIEIGEVHAYGQTAEKLPELKDGEIFYNLLQNYLGRENKKSGKITDLQQILMHLKNDLDKINMIKEVIVQNDWGKYRQATRSLADFKVFLEKLDEDIKKAGLIINVLSDLNVDVYKSTARSVGTAVKESKITDKWEEFLEIVKKNLPFLWKKEAARTSMVRPANPGVSIGHYQGAAGTFGAVVYDQGGQPMILSNNHVLANTSTTAYPKARINDAIVQPANLDGDNGVIAVLANYAPLNPYPQANVIDCAAARPLNPQDIQTDILEIGKVKGTAQPAVGLKIKKSGRTTGLTMGVIRAVDATINVNYGDGETLRFENQILATKMSEPGDSGSLVVDSHNKAVGLLFAGSNQSTIINPIQPVLDFLGVNFQNCHQSKISQSN